MSDFLKYEAKGAYHWRNISSNPFISNSFVKSRYMHCIKLLKKYNNTKSNMVLDLGCGDAALSYLLFKYGFSVFGIDTNSLGIQLGVKKHKEKRTNCNLQVLSIDNIADESFDLIVCSDVIEHVKEYEKFRDHIYRILKKNGVAVISTPIKYTKFPFDKEHFIEWYPEEWKIFWAKYKNVDFFISHPIAILELFRIKQIKIIINFIYIFYDLFKYNHLFQQNTVQYAVLVK